MEGHIVFTDEPHPLARVSRMLYLFGIMGMIFIGPWWLFLPLIIFGAIFSIIASSARTKAQIAAANTPLPKVVIPVDDDGVDGPPSSSSIQPSQGEMNQFNGTWTTDWGDMLLQQEDSFVRGEFAGAKLEGLVMHGKLFFEWAKPEDNMGGKGVLQVTEDGITGSWGHGVSSEDGGPIKGDRITASPSSQTAPPLMAPPPLTEELMAAFSEMDTDHDGFITREELTAAMERAGHALTEKQISEIITAADATEDGRIDLLEFSRYGDSEGLLQLVSSPSPSENTEIEQRSDEIQAQAKAKIEEARQRAEAKVEETSKLAREKLEQAEQKVPEALRKTDAYEDARERVETAIEKSEKSAEEAIEVAAQRAGEEIDERAADVTQAVVQAVEQAEQTIVESVDADLDQLTSIFTQLDSALMSSERAKIITESSSKNIKLGMKVDRIDSTIGYGIDASLRGGKTVIGTVDGMEHPVAIRLPKDMNDMASALRSGQDFEQTVRLADFNSIRKMLQFDLT